jgi:hypothetical protein
MGKNYNPLLTICSFAYLFVLLTIHWLAPQLKPANVERPQQHEGHGTLNKEY